MACSSNFVVHYRWVGPFLQFLMYAGMAGYIVFSFSMAPPITTVGFHAIEHLPLDIKIQVTRNLQLDKNSLSRSILPSSNREAAQSHEIRALIMEPMTSIIVCLMVGLKSRMFSMRRTLTVITSTRVSNLRTETIWI